MVDALIVTVVSVLNILLALLVLSRNPRSKLNQRFALFVSSLVIWTVLNFASDFANQYNLLLSRLTFASISLIIVTLFLFSEIFPKELVWPKRRPAAIVTYSLAILAAILSMGPFVATSVEKVGAGIEVTTGPLYLVYVLIIPITVGFLFQNFYRQYQKANAVERRQEAYLIAGLTVYILLAGVAQLIIPLFFDTWASSRLGPIFTLAFVGFSVFAIVRHKLFDIRLLVARSVGYILSITFLAGLYGLITFTFISRVLFASSSDISALQQTVYTLLAVLIAFTFPPIKRFFDRMTNKVFYRDAYEPQVLLNSLNKTLVSTIELKKLLQEVSGTISGTLKTEYALFDIQQGDSKERVVATPDTVHIAHADLEHIQHYIPALKEKVVVTDSLESKDARLQKVLRANNIAVVAHLTNTVGSARDGLGYLILGDKKSGNPYSSEDIRILEIIADELVIAVQNALRFDEIQNFNITLQEKVDDATRKLRRTNEKLKQLDATKDDFISMASHQLRTPLTSVKGYVSMVLDGDAGKITAQQEKLLEQAFTSSQRMVFLIADLLNVSRLKTGKFVIEAKPTNLADVVGGEIEQLVETAKGRDLKLEYHKPKEFPTLNLDETKIRQVIMNFVDNAIYYTPAGGEIAVNLVDKPDSIEFTVVDNGLGVPKHEQPHLFTKFYRAQNAKKARPDGTGLGLFMAKKVIVAQGGAILFKSVEGKGSTFGFTFAKKRLEVPKTTEKVLETATKA